MSTVTAFFEGRIIASGEKAAVTHRIEDGYAQADFAAIDIFDDATGARIDADYWDAGKTAPARGRGRPSLGVTPREVTLLPRHWDWLRRQKGGASAALRRLVDDAMAAPATPEARRDAVYRFLTATSGDRSGYEEAIRALYRGEAARLTDIIGPWPDDIKSYAMRLLGD
ncbi:DUF2239 family protein [Allosphingosinicella vermicomposti]|uniref:DUF2239 family protein n=1 Tax=Allosphingosinicella vermicomposti TaxID=614671 RepID=UPI000D10CDEE|nr:DUF2239 family protein [Allosphingosinicella vermicomposti]